MSSAFPQEHPSPHRGAVSVWVLLFALAAGPAGWVAQLLLGYGLASYACYPSSEPRLTSPPPGWSGEHLILLVINVACLALALGGLFVALGSWRRSRKEKEGGALDVGEGRTRFLALCGVLTGLLFSVAIGFDTAPILSVPACWRMAG